MPDMTRDSWTTGDTSAPTSASTVIPHVDPEDLFNGVVAGINFRSATGGASVRVEKGQSVRKIINTAGPRAILGDEEFHLRWIHLPVNSMTWIQELMEKIDNERHTQDFEKSQEIDEGPKPGGILRDNVWKHAFHGRHSAGIHSRFMRPLCARYSSADPEDPESDDSDSIHQNTDVLALHLPYLHWESYYAWKERQHHILHMKELTANNEHCQCLNDGRDVFDGRLHKNEILLHQQLFLSKPLHDRRTLDQSYFYNLRKVAYRDDDQVIGQHTLHYEGEQQDNQRKMMMVDQLWMWVIDGNTVITSFPETSTGKRNDADVLQRVLTDLKPSLAQSTRSMNGLIALIIDSCTGVFNRSDINPDLAFFEFFADEIGTAKSEVDELYSSFYNTSQSIETLWLDPNVSTTSLTYELDSLFSIKDELKLLRRVEKIISDLHKIDFLCSQQTDVLYALSKSNSRSSRSLTDLFETAKHHRRVWADMGESAQAALDSLQGLLDLKQRQANVSEARTVRYQVEISARQGRSIMLLTVMTIVFLPVSVIAAIFSMNAFELNGGKVHFGKELAIMVPVTFAVIAVALGTAFREAAWDLIVLLFRRIPL